MMACGFFLTSECKMTLSNSFILIFAPYRCQEHYISSCFVLQWLRKKTWVCLSAEMGVLVKVVRVVIL